MRETGFKLINLRSNQEMRMGSWRLEPVSD